MRRKFKLELNQLISAECKLSERDYKMYLVLWFRFKCVFLSKQIAKLLKMLVVFDKEILNRSDKYPLNTH